MTSKDPLSLPELQKEWYARLEQSGFEDIEVTVAPDSPLREWHSFRFIEERAQLRKLRRSEYQVQIDLFANSPEFPEITKLIVKHRHSKFTANEIEYIWTQHREGLTERSLAEEMRVSQTCIHFLLKRMRAWMELL